jgi:hypothetical protein
MATADASSPAPAPVKLRGSNPQSGDTCTIALKLPSGLTLQAYVMEQSREQTPGGFRDVPMARAVGEPFTLHGAALPRGADRPEIDYLIVGGFAITPGCPRDLWENWYAANKDSHLVRSGLIFQVNSEGDARKEAKGRANLENGFEPIDPEDPAKKTNMRQITRGERVA